VRILILEDDPFIALDLQAIVEGEGHVASVCGSNAEARRWLDDDIDFALLDVDLGDGKSFTVASALHRRAIPFAFVTASRRSEIPAPLAGASFVAKPFMEEAILACLPRAPAAPIRPQPRPAAAEQPAAL
jgi:DNA-binding response OmpR family regulator